MLRNVRSPTRSRVLRTLGVCKLTDGRLSGNSPVSRSFRRRSRMPMGIRINPSRNNEKQKDTNVRMGRTRKHKIIDPEGKERDNTARRQNHTDQTNGVLSPLVKESSQNLNGGFRAHIALSLRMTE